MEIINPLELILKLFFIGVEVVINLVNRKREKALIGTMESFDQRLKHLEDKLNKI